MAVTGMGGRDVWGRGGWPRRALHPGTMDKRKALELRPWIPRIHSSREREGVGYRKLRLFPGLEAAKGEPEVTGGVSLSLEGNPCSQ